jgi:Ser/Thr protein kinase RdoA (MazF antagonist)
LAGQREGTRRVGGMSFRGGRRVPEILTPSLVDRLQGLPRAAAVAIESLQRSDACWIHCDAHLDNVLFRSDGTAVLLDWSGAAIGPAAVDVAQVLTEGVNAGARRALATELIGTYRDEFAAGGAEAMIGDRWQALSDGLAPLVQATIARAARHETRRPRIRMQALQENLLRSVSAWASSEHMSKPGGILA